AKPSWGFAAACLLELDGCNHVKFALCDEEETVMCLRLRSIPMIVLLVFFSRLLVFAQAGATGTILGTITDNSGAVVSNAAVTVTNINTGVHNQTRTGSSGDFTVPYLTP